MKLLELVSSCVLVGPSLSPRPSPRETMSWRCERVEARTSSPKPDVSYCCWPEKPQSHEDLKAELREDYRAAGLPDGVRTLPVGKHR